MFDYDKAFSRNIGWVTEQEQQILKGSRVAIAGCGGVGGTHAITLARLGISKFHIADFDTFEVENTNRQMGASMSNVNRPKQDVIREMILDINPQADVQVFPEGVTSANHQSFLADIDLFIDGFDFFAMQPRIMCFHFCNEHGIPAMTVAPLGMGTSFLTFRPSGMSFEAYFGLTGKGEYEQYLRFYIGLNPLNRTSEYLVDPDPAWPERKRGPSTCISCTLSSAVAAANALKILLNRGELIEAPKGMSFDPYLNSMEIFEISDGCKNTEFIAAIERAKQVFNVE